MSKIPSPCIDVCKYKNKGYCIGCGMTKDQKKEFKSLDKKKQKLSFIEMLVEQQGRIGKYRHWEAEYRRKCRKKDVECPLDTIAQRADAAE